MILSKTTELIKNQNAWNKIPLEGTEGNWDATGNLETIISSSLENCSSIFELTFLKASSLRETKQNMKEEKVQNQKGDEF